MNLNEDIARHLINERVAIRRAARLPTHPRTARMLRRLAERVERDN